MIALNSESSTDVEMSYLVDVEFAKSLDSSDKSNLVDIVALVDIVLLILLCKLLSDLLTFLFRESVYNAISSDQKLLSLLLSFE